MSTNGPFVEFEKVKATKETTKGLCCTGIDGTKETWVPKSQISDDSEVYGEGHEGTLSVSEWWATVAGLV